MKTLKSLTVLLAVMTVMFACKQIIPPVVNPETGKGTIESPYSVEGALKAGSGQAFVKAYIVGFMQTGDENSPVFSAETDSIRTNILIADTTVAVDKYMAVQLPKGAVRDGLNLADNKSLLGQEVLIYGEITSYFGALGIRGTSYAKVGGKEFGELPSENPNAIFAESFESSLGQFTEYSVSGDQRWAVDAKFKYVMISGYVDLTNYANEDWLISPAISLPNEAAKLTFNTVTRYFANLDNEALVMISENYQDGDPNEATWDKLTCKLTSANDWTLVKSPEVDLSAYAGKQVRIAFKYIATADKAGTWELNNLVIEKGQASSGNTGVAVGSGTETDPYNCAATVAEQGSKGQGPLAYVEGYIVGCYNFDKSDNYVFGVDTIETNILIADQQGSPVEFVAVQLPSGDVRDALNLKDHPENLGQKVLLYGNLESYCSKPGVKNVAYAKMGDKEFGIKPQDPSKAIFYAAMTAGADGFTCVDITKPANIDHIWAYDSQYKCVKATAYKGSKQDGEGYWVSPAIDLSKVGSATLTFENAANYTADVEQEFKLFVSTTSDGTSFSEGWTELPIDKRSTTGFSWELSTVDISSVCGNAGVRFAFRYFSNPSMCGTWEVKEFMIK